MSITQALLSRGRQAGDDEGPAAVARVYPYGINADVLAAGSGPVDPERAASALRAIPANLAREAWLRVVFAAHAAGAPFDAFLTWCRTGGDKFTGDDDALKAWESFDPARPEGIGAGTLFHAARQHGWSEPSAAAAQAANDESDEQARPTDSWLAGHFVATCAPEFRYDHSAKQWRRYRGGSWALCRKDEHVEAIKGLGGRLMQEHGRLRVANPNGIDLKALLACATRAQSAQGVGAALKLAQSDPALAISGDELDTDPDLLNVENGVLHLPTAALRPHDPALMLCRQSPVAYDAGAKAPMFLQFMAEVACGDSDMVEFEQRAFGYMLSGHVSEEKLFFWLGNGANGKSVLANVVRQVMGTYAVVVPPAFLMQTRRDGGGATPELVMLAGARVALANETEAGSRLSAQTVKVAVSTEHITARPLYGAPMTFAPTHKLLIRGNHRPIITDDDEGIWRRILLVPFGLDVPAARRDPGLEARLMTEAPGILRWMVEGFVKWRSSGLEVAKRVTEAGRAYRNESDLLGQWLGERCETASTFRVRTVLAYGSYRQWCGEQGQHAFTKASFTRTLGERGFTVGRESTGQRKEFYVGLRLNGTA